MPVAQARLHRIRLPFKRKYTHSLADRLETEGLVLEVELASGVRGYGEALPRPYVTGETLDTVTETLATVWRARWPDAPTDSFERLTRWLGPQIEDAMAHRTLAACCAAELALLDAVGQATKQSVSAAVGRSVQRRIHYTLPFSAGSVDAARRLGRIARFARLRDVKVKVGFENDLEMVGAIRAAVGRHVDIRVDANGAWSAAEAIDRLRGLAEFHISAAEQPVAADDIEGMAHVQAALDIPVVADESACTVADVERLAAAGACRMINVRVGKCGGLLGARRMAKAAERCELAWHIGCLVGETALLSAAGRHLAFGLSGWAYVEGSYGPFLLERDIAKPQPRWGWRGSARALAGSGLGVRVDPAALQAVTLETRDVS